MWLRIQLVLANGGDANGHGLPYWDSTPGSLNRASPLPSFYKPGDSPESLIACWRSLMDRSMLSLLGRDLLLTIWPIPRGIQIINPSWTFSIAEYIGGLEFAFPRSSWEAAAP